MLNKPNSLSHVTNVSRIFFKKFWLDFDPVARVWVFSNGLEDATLGQFVLINLNLFNLMDC